MTEPKCCEKCGKTEPGVQYDRPARAWWCHWCWFHTPPRSRPDLDPRRDP